MTHRRVLDGLLEVRGIGGEWGEDVRGELVGKWHCQVGMFLFLLLISSWALSWGDSGGEVVEWGLIWFVGMDEKRRGLT